MNGLKKAIKYMGGRKALADALGLTVMAVHQWESRRVPPERAVQIERLTGGKVRRIDLRPDLYGKA